VLIEAKDDGDGGDNWSYKSCKAPVKSSPPTNHHPVLQAGCPSCHPTVKSLKGKYHIPWTCLPQAHLGVFQRCLWPLIVPGYLGGGLPRLSSALWCQYSKIGDIPDPPESRHDPAAHYCDGRSRSNHLGILHCIVFVSVDVWFRLKGQPL